MRDFQREFDDFAPTVYLDCAYQGPFPRVTVERIHKAIELKRRPDRLYSPEYFDLPRRARARLARLIGADPSEIALTSSATQGFGIVATGLQMGPGDEVVIASRNFPSNLFSWLHLRRLGVRVHAINTATSTVTVDDVAPVMTPRTRLLALDWVSYMGGERIDLAALGELAHRHGSLFAVDGTQGVGALELNLHEMPVDVMAVAAYKWLLGPYGTAFVYLNSPILDRLDCPVINWMSIEGSEDFDALPGSEFTLVREARIFDVGETSNFLNLHALEASLEFVEGVGVRAVSEHCWRLLDRLQEGIEKAGYRLSCKPGAALRSTILGFQAGSLDATAALHQKLRAHQVAVSLRHDVIRVSPYLYNNEADIDKLLSIVGRA
ncbi:MAG: aminotransferase class V-fold PLP-dependent enzyme [Terriglobia bacterium]